MIRKRTFALAQDYVEKHFGVRYLFPIKPGKKFPPLIRDNLAKASNDPVQLEAWEKRWPGCNWGLSHKVSGVMVADIDVNKAKGKIGDETYLDLDLIYGWPETETTTTPSGGFHKVYIGPHIMALGENGIGRDIDSPNYTLIPGCTFDDGTSYVGNDLEAVKCPQWIYDTIRSSKGSRKGTIDNPGEIAVGLDKPENIDWSIDFLKNDAKPSIEGSGGDKALLDTCLKLRDKGISIGFGAQLLNDYYDMQPRWDVDDLIKKMQNAYAYATQEKVGGTTAEADFADQPEEPIQSSPKAKEEKQERSEKRAVLALIKDEWVVIAEMKRWVERDPKKDKRKIWDKGSFEIRYNKDICPKRGSAHDIILRLKKGGPTIYDSVGFKPGQPQTLDDGGTFNMYRQPDIEPKEGDIAWWNEHLEYLLPEQEYRDHLLNWMAWLLKNLDKKPKHALILQGEVNGTGKSFIGKVLTRILHQANVSVVPQNSLSGRFNSWALQCKLIVVEELRASDKRAVKEALHDIITEDRINVEKKGIDSIMVDTCFGVLAFTNDFAALDLDNTDRRYLVISTERTEAEAKAKEAAGYFIRLFAKLEDDSAMAAVAYSLMNRDLKGYNGQSAAPMTAAKENMKTASMNDLDHYLVDSLVKWPLNSRVVCIDDVILNLPRNLSNKSTRLVSTIKTFLMRNGAIELGQCTTPKGERPRLYAMGPQAGFIAQQTRSFAGKLYEDDNARTKKNLPPNDLDASEEFGDTDDVQ
jgi:hypothetical protein